jgi:hypothetical protein
MSIRRLRRCGCASDVRDAMPSGSDRLMPPVSKAQNRLMQAAAADPKVAKRTGVPQRVAKEFTENLKPGSVKKLPARKSKG